MGIPRHREWFLSHRRNFFPVPTTTFKLQWGKMRKSVSAGTQAEQTIGKEFIASVGLDYSFKIHSLSEHIDLGACRHKSISIQSPAVD
jgi:hypothetical protein